MKCGSVRFPVKCGAVRRSTGPLTLAVSARRQITLARLREAAERSQPGISYGSPQK